MADCCPASLSPPGIFCLHPVGPQPRVAGLLRQGGRFTPRRRPIYSEKRRRKQVCGREGMIGLRGRVVAPLNPEGVIRIQGELWKASCTDDSIGTDEEVVVVEIEGLRLVVKRKNDAGR
ncbi:NfeD family protein [Chloroflexota bacterium]